MEDPFIHVDAILVHLIWQEYEGIKNLNNNLCSGIGVIDSARGREGKRFLRFGIGIQFFGFYDDEKDYILEEGRENVFISGEGAGRGLREWNEWEGHLLSNI